jgi:hypothetical protein
MILGDLLDLIAVCEGKYAEAKRKGYAKNPDVIATVSVLKLACAALATANDDLATKGFFGRAVARMRAHLACRATRKACLNFDAAIERAWSEKLLHNRCSVLLTRAA